MMYKIKTFKNEDITETETGQYSGSGGWAEI